jgi:integrase
MDLLLSGVDRSLIAIWLGHESLESTQIYPDAELAQRDAIIAKVTPIKGNAPRPRLDDQLIAFLKSL